MAFIEYGKQIWKEREQEMADTMAIGVAQVKSFVQDLQDENDLMKEYAFEQQSLNEEYEQRLHNDDALIQYRDHQLGSANKTIQELEERLKHKNYECEMLHQELSQACDDKHTIQCLKEEVETLKAKDAEIEDLKGLNEQLLEDKMGFIEYGKQVWKEREQEMADTIAIGVAQVKSFVQDLQDEHDTLKEYALEQQSLIEEYEQRRHNDDVIIQYREHQLGSANKTIQDLEESLKHKNYESEMLHQELSRACDDKQTIQCLKEEVETLKAKDAEIEDLKGLNEQLLEDKIAFIEYGKQIWKEREQEMADTIAIGVARVKSFVQDLQDENDSLKEFASEQQSLNQEYEQRQHNDDAIIQYRDYQLEAAQTSIQELEETLKKKNAELSQASDDKHTIQCLKEEVETLKAIHQSYEQTVHEKQSTLESAFTEQWQRAAEAEELQKSLQAEHTNNQELKREIASQKEVLKRCYTNYCTLMENMKQQEKRLKELSTAQTSLTNTCQELESRNEELQATLDKKKQKKRWFKWCH